MSSPSLVLANSIVAQRLAAGSMSICKHALWLAAGKLRAPGAVGIG
jgi:hypothetical protein